ncbi:MAG: DUF3754 domain-containing protein [Pseudomonadota bacterium]
MCDDTIEETRERFIPIGRQEIVADLLAAPHWTDEAKKQFGEFCTIFGALYHYKFHARSEELKRCYTPFNPDTDIVSQHDYSDEDKQKLRDTLDEEMRLLLDNANYEELTIEDLNRAIKADSYYGLNVWVDLDDFEKLVVYFRGSAMRVESKRTWYSLFLSEKVFEIPIYKRLFLLLKFKTEDQVVDERLEKWKADNPESDEAMAEKFEKKARKQVQKARKNLPTEISDKQVFLKLFKDLPRSDLEMLFPNQEVRLKLFDKIKLALTGGGGTIFGIFTTIGKVAAAATNPILLIGAFVGLIGIIVRQIMNIFNQRTKYMMTLSRNLYFHNLDNNVGVMNYLIDMAEEEEGKEAILAYYFLHSQPDKDYTKEVLDREIEGYLRNKYDTDIDFEVDDGIRKLREEGILTEQEGGILKVLDLKGASAILDKQWDNFFNPD